MMNALPAELLGEIATHLDDVSLLALVFSSKLLWNSRHHMKRVPNRRGILHAAASTGCPAVQLQWLTVALPWLRIGRVGVLYQYNDCTLEELLLTGAPPFYIRLWIRSQERIRCVSPHQYRLACLFRNDHVLATLAPYCFLAARSTTEDACDFLCRIPPSSQSRLRGLRTRNCRWLNMRAKPNKIFTNFFPVPNYLQRVFLVFVRNTASLCCF